MIREPTVGMRVDVGGAQWCGKRGRIVEVESNKFWVQVRIDGINGLWPKKYNAITEIKESDMKKGDLVTSEDSSYAVRVDKHTTEDIDFRGKEYEVIGFNGESYCALKNQSGNHTVHDVFIKNTTNGRIYLHSKAFCGLAKPKVKEITPEQMMKDLEEKYGGKVKITRQ
jgi:hypothetical protein